MIQAAVLDDDYTVGDGGGHHEGAGLDTIGDDGPLAAVKLLNALDGDSRRALTRDPGPAGVEVVGQVNDFRLARRGLDDGRTLGHGCGHHDVTYAQHARPEWSAQEHLAALELFGFQMNVAA